MFIKINSFSRLNILRKKRFSYFLNFSIILLLVLGSFFYISSPVMATEEQASSSIGISFFANQTGKEEWDWFSIGLTDRLINRLTSFDLLSVVSRKDLVQFFREIEMIPKQEEMNKRQLTQFHEKFGSEIIFYGTFFYSSATKINLSLKKYESSTGQITAFRDFSLEKESVLDFENILVDF